MYQIISHAPSTIFSTLRHQALFKALKTSHDSAPELINTLKGMGQWSDNGNKALVTLDYLTELQEKGSTPGAIPGLMRLLLNAHKQRLIAGAAHELSVKLRGGIVPSADLEAAEAQLLTLTTELAGTTQTVLTPMAEIVEQVLDITDEGRPLKTGIKPLDDKVGGFWKGDLVLLAGRPSCGKTAFALSVADLVSRHDPVVFFSLEMSSQQLSQRLVSMESGVMLSRVRNKQWRNSDDESERVHKAVVAIQKRRLIITDSPCSVSEMRAHLARQVHISRPSLIVIDYLQLIPPEDKKIPREQQISTISRSLKLLAKKLGIPFLVLSQLNRTATNEKPQLHHLRESGALEQDADMVLAINHGAVDTDVVILKHRNGPTGEVPIYWDPETTLFGGR